MSAWRAFLYAWSLDRCADMLWTTTLAWLATSASNPAAQGLIVAAAMLPHLLVLLFGGAAADTYGSATVAKVTTVAKASLLLVLLMSDVVADLPLLILGAVAAVVGAVDGFHDPAMESWGARLRTASEQREAAATEATLWRIAQLVGAALGGVLVGIGAVIAISVAVVLFLAQRVFLWVLDRNTSVEASSPRPEAGHPGGERTVQQIQDGLQFLRGRPVLWATMGMQTTVTIVIGATLMLLIPLMIREQDWPAVTYGVAAGCFGLGLASGAGLVLRLQKAGRLAGGGTGVPFVAFGAAAAGQLPLLVIALALAVVGPVGVVLLLALFGFFLGPVAPLMIGFRRELTPDHQQGVVAAASRILVIGMEPLGPLVGGVVVTMVGSATTLTGIAIGGVLLAIACAAGARRAQMRISSP